MGFANWVVKEFDTEYQATVDCIVKVLIAWAGTTITAELRQGDASPPASQPHIGEWVQATGPSIAMLP